MDPYGHQEALGELAAAGVSAFAMELMPRITRAQVMDVLSSQANLAGYRAVIDAAAEFGRALPMMMTAAGTVPAAKVFVMGAGVAGLQAIATARRLGAIVTATDVRPAAKEQVASLGAKFVAVEDEEFKQAETAAGYAKPMSAGIPGQAGRPGRRAHQEAGHRHHHGADPRPAGAAPGLRRHGGEHEAGLGASSTSPSSAAAMSRAPSRARSSTTANGVTDRRPSQRPRPPRRLRLRRSMPATSSPSSRR